MKKSVKIGIVLIIIAALLIPYSIKSYGTTEFFEVTSDEITVSDVIEAKLIIENVSYDKFIFTLMSDSDISSTEIVEDSEDDETEEENEETTEITVENEYEISFEIDKETSSVSEIILQCALPEDIQVGDTITLLAIVTNSKDEEDYETSQVVITIVQETLSAESTDNTTTTDVVGSQTTSNETTENGYESSSDLTLTFGNSSSNGFSMSGSNSEDDSSDMSSIMSSSFSNDSTISDSLKTTSSNSYLSGETTETVTYNGSDDSYLIELSIDSYELNKTFSKESTTYFITVDSDVESLDITATAEDDGATVCIYGNSDLQTGSNKILITVTAENGNTRTYRIYVTKN